MLAQLTAQVNKAASTAAKVAKTADTNLFEGLVSAIDIFKNVLLSIVILIGFYLLGKFVAHRIVRSLRESRGESLYPDMEILINRFSVVVSVAIGIASVMQFIFNLNFMQVLGFFGLGLSFAFKDLLENLIAGAVIILQNRFRIGDFIKITSSGLTGKIIEIQTRATILKAADGTEIIVPNAELMSSTVISYTAHHTRRIDFTFGIDFDADLKKAVEIATQVMSQKEGVLKKPGPRVIVKELGESMVKLNMRFWIDPQNKLKSWVLIKSELIPEIKDAFEKAGILIPYPLYSYLEKKRELEK